jgi:hypothetical protein
MTYCEYISRLNAYLVEFVWFNTYYWIIYDNACIIIGTYIERLMRPAEKSAGHVQHVFLRRYSGGERLRSS